MADLSAIRARLKDRQVKEGALGTVEASICTDLSLLDELADLERERADLSKGRDSGSIAGAVSADTSDVDARIEAKRQEIREASIRIVFNALSSVRYQEVVNRFEDPDESERYDFLAALAEASFREAWNDGEKVDLKWHEIQPELSPGEFDDIGVKVLTLNKRRQDIPFSLKPSKPTRS